MINRLLYRIGFPNTVRAVGGLTVALLVFATFALKTRLPVRKSGAILNFACASLAHDLICLHAHMHMAGISRTQSTRCYLPACSVQ